MGGLMPEPLNEQWMRELMTPTVRKGDTRREYILGHLLLLSLSTGAGIVGVVLLVFPDALFSSALGESLPEGLARAWALIYALGGWLVVAGCARLDARYEVAGLMLLAGCYASYAYAIVAVNSWQPGGIVVSILVLAAVGCTSRAYVLRFEPRSRPWARRS